MLVLTSLVDVLGDTCWASGEMEGKEDVRDEMLRGGAPGCYGYTVMKPQFLGNTHTHMLHTCGLTCEGQASSAVLARQTLGPVNNCSERVRFCIDGLLSGSCIPLCGVL